MRCAARPCTLKVRGVGVASLTTCGRPSAEMKLRWKRAPAATTPAAGKTEAALIWYAEEVGSATRLRGSCLPPAFLIALTACSAPFFASDSAVGVAFVLFAEPVFAAALWFAASLLGAAGAALFA